MTEYRGSWYVQYQGVEHGPFGFGEVAGMLSGGKLEGTIHIWREGLAHWLPIRVDALLGNTPALLLRRELIQYERSQLERAANTEKAKAHAQSTRRQHPRRGLVATVYGLGSAGKRHYLGVLADLSARGLGIRMDNPVAWPAGTEFKLEIVPLTLTGLQSFRVGGQIRWTSALDMGLELIDFAQAERALALLDLRRLASSVAPKPDDDSAPTSFAA